MKPFPIILSSPSGGGKTTIAHMLLAMRPDVGYSVSCTTRPPRNGEADGRDYHFISLEQFKRGQKARDFAESAEVHGHLYGTLRAEVERVLSSGTGSTAARAISAANSAAARSPTLGLER